jgi:EAL domain-containing protein (putative c-di-GMP-specific phosphodiesterase class I)
VGVEALLRWDDPARGMVRPEEFIPLLEETGLIIPVGEWFLEQVLQQSVEWQRRFPGRPAMNIKVNISPKQLTYPHLVTGIGDLLHRTSANPDNVCIEFAEAGMTGHPEIAWANLRAAKALGLSLGLDEFGTGYSSLSFLRAFTLDLLKLDQSFIEQVTGSKEDQTIVEHVIALARSMGVATVAYGIQNEAQMELLRSLNCDLGQGPYFSPPQPPSVIDQLLGGDPRDDEWRPPARSTASASAGATRTAEGATPPGESGAPGPPVG